MRSENAILILVGAVLVAGYLCLVIKRRGFRRAMFPAAITGIAGVLNLGRRGIFRRTIKVYSFPPEGVQKAEIGLEVSTYVLWWPVHHFVPLTPGQALSLSRLLEQAAGEWST